MTGETQCRTITVTNPQGLHMRPLAAFVELANRFQCTIQVRKDNHPPINGKSLINLLSLAAEQGEVVHLEVNGPDAYEAIGVLSESLMRVYPD